MQREPLVLPFYVTPMPLNEYGEGPETDLSKIQRVEWQIWDQLHQTVCVHENKAEAESHAELLNSITGGQ